MANKRSATQELNHDNWDREESPEEAGSFVRASEDVLKKRVYKTAKRRITKDADEGTSGVFNPVNLAKFNSKPSQPTTQMFGFLSKLQTDVPKSNGLSEKLDSQNEVNKSKSPISFGAVSKTATETEQKEPPKFSFIENENHSSSSIFNLNVRESKNKSEITNMCNFGNNKQESVVKSNNSDSYYAKLKGLNQSVAKWINTHVEMNPLINLQPIFKDYEKFFDDLEKEVEKNVETVTNKKDDVPAFSFTSNTNESCNTLKFGGFNEKGTPSETQPFKFGASSSTSNNVTNSQSTIPNLNFGNMQPKTEYRGFSFTTATEQTKPNENEDESDEPPKLEVKQIEEEGHIYTIRCKLFIKKDGNFIEKGVGSLFLKPVPDSDKIQLIIRAHNSLGNVLCNFILSKSIPIQKMGKNNVMLVCVPSPESQPPPVPILIKVKTEKDADELLNSLETHKN